MPSEPKLEARGGVYLLTWRDEGIQIRVDRVHSEKTGVYGELLIRNSDPGLGPAHLHGPIHFNFLSSTTRSQLIKHLMDIAPVGWSGMMEQLCYVIVEEHRTGQPAINIAGHPMPKSLGMRIAPIIQERQATLFFGDGDSLKSFFATYLSILVRSGKPAAELKPEPGNVLYLDYETDVDTFWDRANMITSGLNIAIPDGIFYRQMIEPLENELPRVNAIVMTNDINFVVVDSAAPAVLEPNSPESATGYFRSLRSLQVTSLTIAHQTKTSKTDYPFGSTFWRNLPRSNFHIKADRNQADRNQSDVTIGLRHTKSNNGRRLATLAFKFMFTEGCVTIEKTDPREHEELARDLPTKVKILSMLNQPMTVAEITKELDEKQDTVKKTLERGLRDGTFARNGHNWAKAYIQ